MGMDLPVVSLFERTDAGEVDLAVPDDELMRIAKDGIKNADGPRRGPLALDMLSMNAIRDYFLGIEKRNPTDIELESIAQTWSEHCKHTIFSAQMDDDVTEGIFRKLKRVKKISAFRFSRTIPAALRLTIIISFPTKSRPTTAPAPLTLSAAQ
jgi:hypothetical protein